ncbi:MAG: glycosyltransferase family 2 protein [Candidatus Omnitrophota bacterium]
MKGPLVYIVVLNWNNYEDTAECIESLFLLKYDNFKILLVDNASNDGFLVKLKDRFPNIEVIENQENFGFAKGNNIGIDFAFKKKAEFVFILNNDVIVKPDTLDPLVKAASDNDSNLYAPKVYYYNQPEIINSLGTKLNWLRLRPELSFCGQKDKGQFKVKREAEVLVGCALFFSRNFFKKIGLFDESFYMIYEDADICFRNLEANGKNIVVPDSVVYHKASATLGKFSAMSSYYSIRNFLYLLSKHGSCRRFASVFFGLFYLIIKHLILFLGSNKNKLKSTAFFSGISDFFHKRMNKTERAFNSL